MTPRTRLLAVLWAAGGVSVVCNVLAAEPTLVGRGVAAWPPIALMLVIEVLARLPLPPGRLRWVAGVGAGAVAVTAGLASFHHMHEVALAAGESELVAWMFPLTVDGLAVVASVGLMGQHESERDLEDRNVHVVDLTPSPSTAGLTPAAAGSVGVVFPPVLNGTGSTK